MKSVLLLGLRAGAVVVLMACAIPASAQERTQDRIRLEEDSLLTSLVREALQNRPEVVRAQAAYQAEGARVPQAGALPDPVLSLGIQNDGFQGLQIGKMETSWWSVIGAQSFPWFGKQSLRSQAQSLEARRSEAALERARLSVRAEVERAYVDLLLIRDQLLILGRLEKLWIEAEGLSRSRYEAGEGAQSDILRAQLERGRLAQQRLILTSEETSRIAALNRTVGRSLETPVSTSLSLRDLSDPVPVDSLQLESSAEAQSPELQQAELARERSGVLLSLAQKDYYPDFTISGGVMPRGGDFETMWQAGIAISIPVWAGRKQSNAVCELRLREQEAESGAGSIRQLLRLRTRERRLLLLALLETNRLYRSGLLVQSEATVSSSMAQYQVGRVPFASVLETLSGYLTDVVGFYESVATTQRIDIAQRELSLDPVTGPGLGLFGGASMPGKKGMGGAASPAMSASPPATTTASTAMPRM